MVKAKVGRVFVKIAGAHEGTRLESSIRRQTSLRASGRQLGPPPYRPR